MLKLEIDHEGKKLPVEIDPTEHGFLPQAKVDELKKEFYAKGAKSRDKDVVDLQKQLDQAVGQIDAVAKSGSGNHIEAEKLRQQITDLHSKMGEVSKQMMAEREARKNAEISATISKVAAGFKFRDGTQTVFERDAQSSKRVNDDGTVVWQLPDGQQGTLEQFSDHWRKSPVGQALVLTEQKPGAGTAPSSGSINGATLPSDRPLSLKEYGALRETTHKR